MEKTINELRPKGYNALAYCCKALMDILKPLYENNSKAEGKNKSKEEWAKLHHYKALQETVFEAMKKLMQPYSQTRYDLICFTNKQTKLLLESLIYDI